MRYRAICKNREFSRIYAKGKSYVHPQVVLYVLKNKNRPTRVGFTATKKIGNAVKRNRARRVMKEALAPHLPADAKGFDLVLVARGQTPQLKSTQLSKTIAKLMQKAGLTSTAPKAEPVKAQQQTVVASALQSEAPTSCPPHHPNS